MTPDPATPSPPTVVGGARGARVTLLGRPGCHLCDEARVVVSRVANDLGVSWEEQSVDDHPQLLARYADQIPVTFVDGRRHDFWRVDEARLRRALGDPRAGDTGHEGRRA